MKIKGAGIEMTVRTIIITSRKMVLEQNNLKMAWSSQKWSTEFCLQKLMGKSVMGMTVNKKAIIHANRAIEMHMGEDMTRLYLSGSETATNLL